MEDMDQIKSRLDTMERLLVGPETAPDASGGFAGVDRRRADRPYFRTEGAYAVGVKGILSRRRQGNGQTARRRNVILPRRDNPRRPNALYTGGTKVE